MAATKYRLVIKNGDKTAYGLSEFEKRETMEKLAIALNKRFPNRRYRVEAITQTEKERFLELVK